MGNGRNSSGNRNLEPKLDLTRGSNAQAGDLHAGSSFAARFGRVILQHGVAAIPSALYHFQGKLDLSAQQVWFVSYILAHKWDSDLPHPSLHNMSRNVGMTYRNLLVIKDGLVERSLLRVHARVTPEGGPAPSAYDFSSLFAALEDLILESGTYRNPIEDEGDADDLALLDPSFAARYGRVILKYGVTAVPRAIFTHQQALGLSPQQVWFISYIFSFRWSTALPYPSLKKMATQTGYSRSQIHVIKSELEAAGYLLTTNRSNAEGGQGTNAYDFSELLNRTTELLNPAAASISSEADEITKDAPRSWRAPRPGRRRSTSEVVTPRSSAPQTGSSDKDRTPVVKRNVQGGGEKERTGGSEMGRNGSVVGTSPDVVQEPGQGVVKGVAHEVETSHEEEYHKDDSNHPSTKKVEQTADGERTSPPYSPYIAAVITDFSDELNDSVHVVSNVTQALRLWQSSGLGEQAFIELLYEAKRLVRAYQGKQGLGTINNKMAYFYKILRQQVTTPSA